MDELQLKQLEEQGYLMFKSLLSIAPQERLLLRLDDR